MVTGTLALFLTLKNPFSNKKNRWRGAIRPKRTHIFHLPTGLILRGKLLVFTGWHMFHWWPFFLGQFKISILTPILRPFWGSDSLTSSLYTYWGNSQPASCKTYGPCPNPPQNVNVQYLRLAFWGRTSVSTHTTVHLWHSWLQTWERHTQAWLARPRCSKQQKLANKLLKSPNKNHGGK